MKKQQATQSHSAVHVVCVHVRVVYITIQTQIHMDLHQYMDS